MIEWKQMTMQEAETTLVGVAPHVGKIKKQNLL